MHRRWRPGEVCHCRNRINWSADRARTPNIKWLITLASPLTIRCLPPNSSLSRALLRSATVRSVIANGFSRGEFDLLAAARVVVNQGNMAQTSAVVTYLGTAIRGGAHNIKGGD